MEQPRNEVINDFGNNHLYCVIIIIIAKQRDIMQKNASLA